MFVYHIPGDKAPFLRACLRAASRLMRGLVELSSLASGAHSIHIMRRGHIIFCKRSSDFPDAMGSASRVDAPDPALQFFGQVLKDYSCISLNT
jgi:hypothetical protein